MQSVLSIIYEILDFCGSDRYNIVTRAPTPGFPSTLQGQPELPSPRQGPNALGSAIVPDPK